MAGDWIDAVAAELDRLENPHRDKKRATILAIVDARLAGKSEETVWEPRRAETCSRSIYHQKWKFDPVFADVLERVSKAARDYQDGRALRALRQAAERLALASPVAVATAIDALRAEDANVRLRAAFGILDRAGIETSTKSTVVSTEDDVSALSDEERATRISAILDSARARRLAATGEDGHEDLAPAARAAGDGV